jgi:hypothetical protein
MRHLALLALVLLGGCSGHELAEPTGPVFALNPGQWQPTPAQLAAPPRSTAP